MIEKRSIYPIHPGDVLFGEIKELDMTTAELARALHVPSNRLYQRIAGKRAMTADTALRLEQWLGVSAGLLQHPMFSRKPCERRVDADWARCKTLRMGRRTNQRNRPAARRRAARETRGVESNRSDLLTNDLADRVSRH